MPRAEQEYYITESDKITCGATGYPVLDIVWLNDDGSKVNESRLITGSEVATGVGNLLSINVSMIVRSSDGGAYTCVASNSYGSDSVSITVHCKLLIKLCSYTHSYSIHNTMRTPQEWLG